jgi:hypothetical protein
VFSHHFLFKNNLAQVNNFEKSPVDLMNFSGSASDMLAAMKAAGIVMPEAEEAALKVPRYLN